ncbi:hypothetical protein WR25_13329 [Diploscapter pachys]|uniref:Importin N-terminal domain-containing protein n=1 Tax=Diploscapter pachys TaxID=2018661 RepID=A0A2A2LVV6_9BILA|nr:hypothetical protein WR25_13329 [Diploscapter pachys]
MQEKAEAEKEKRRKKEVLFRKRQSEQMSFSAHHRLTGQKYTYKPLDLSVNGPPLPSLEEIDASYLVHMKIASPAIHALYNGTDTGQAQEWLNSFRNSVHAWTLCDQILSQRLDPLACYFASQTLKFKISKHLKELPEENYPPLRESLINHLSFFGAASHDQHAEATSTQLCLAIADLYIQVPQWNNWIADLLNQFTSQQGDRTSMLLTLLRVFPEEINEVKVGENRRKQIREELAVNASSVFLYLTHVLQHGQNNADMLKRVFVCLSAYLQNPVLSTDDFATSPLLMSIFHVVGTPDVLSSLHEAASDVIVSALLRAEDQGAHLALAKSLQRNIYQLAEPFNRAVEIEDLDKLNNYARMFVELNESLVEPLVNKTSDDISELGSLYSMDLLLLVAGHHDYSLIEMTFNVWYRISEALFMVDDQDQVARFRPYVNRFLMCLYRHCRLDLDEESLPDQSSEFADFRLKAVEAIRDVVFIIGTNECIQMMYEVLRSASQWNETEAALFIIATVINNLMPEEDGMVPELVTSIVALDANSHPALISTSINLLGGCNEWLEKHRVYLEQVMPWLLRFASSPLYCQMASESIEKIVSHSAIDLVSLIRPLVQLVPSLQASQTNGTQIEAAISSILKACSTLIVHLRPEEMKMAFEELCKPIVENLHRILHHDMGGPNLSAAISSSLSARPSIVVSKSAPILTPTGLAPAPSPASSGSSADKENDKSVGSWTRLANEPVLWIDRVASIFREVCKPQSLSIANTSADSSQRAPWMDVAHHLYEVC